MTVRRVEELLSDDGAVEETVRFVREETARMPGSGILAVVSSPSGEVTTTLQNMSDRDALLAIDSIAESMQGLAGDLVRGFIAEILGLCGIGSTVLRTDDVTSDGPAPEEAVQ